MIPQTIFLQYAKMNNFSEYKLRDASSPFLTLVKNNDLASTDTTKHNDARISPSLPFHHGRVSVLSLVIALKPM